MRFQPPPSPSESPSDDEATLHHSSGSFEYCKRGLGMGLAIVKKFVEMHGGTIAVQPRYPRGTSFMIRLSSSP